MCLANLLMMKGTFNIIGTYYEIMCNLDRGKIIFIGLKKENASCSLRALLHVTGFEPVPFYRVRPERTALDHSAIHASKSRKEITISIV